jgi:hypothetical protein
MPPHNTPRSLLDRASSIRLRTVALLGGLVVLVLALLASLAFLRPDRSDTATAAGTAGGAASPAPSAAPVDTATVAPQDAKTGVAAPDGPAPDLPPFGVDAQALLDEVRSHQIPLADTDAPRLVEVGNRAIARGQADLTATDTAITQDVRNTFPGWSEQNYTDATRCLAEYAERVKARNDGTVPPDSDDHGS